MNSKKLVKGGHTSHLPLHTSNRGITLIALVITIIVLLILAGVTINMVLGDDGIIQNAQAAKKAQDDANKEDKAAIGIAQAQLTDYTQGMTSDEVEKATKIPDEAEGIITKQITGAKDGVIAEIKKFDDGYVPIPKGMAYLEGDKVDEGVVVIDKYGNEFVWVPVDELKENESSNYEDDAVWLIHNENDTVLIDGDEDEGLDSTEFVNDYEEMKTSVETYGGFFVGRYETSWTGSRVASVGNVTAMSNRMRSKLVYILYRAKKIT